MLIKKIKYFGIIVGLLNYCHAYATQSTKVCLTGKLETTFPIYKTAILNAVDLALSQSSIIKIMSVETYFFDNKPLSAINAYNRMAKDHCDAIIGFEYLSDLLLIEKIQSDNKIPIFTSFSSSNSFDITPRNIFLFMPTYDYHAKKMMPFLQRRFGKINNVLLITEVDRPDLNKYKTAYKKILDQNKIHYDLLDFIGNDNQFEKKLRRSILGKNYNFVFVLSGAVGSTKIINMMNNQNTVFIGTENFGSSTNQSLFVRLNNKKINAFVVRNIDFLKSNKQLASFTKAYIEKYSTSPSILSTYAYDAMKIITKTLEKNSSLTIDNILKTNYQGVTGAHIQNKKFYRSNQYVILSIGEKGFAYEE